MVFIQSPKDIPAVLATVLSLAKTAANSGNLHLVTFLGLFCDVIYHLKNVPAELKIVDDASKVRSFPTQFLRRTHLSRKKSFPFISPLCSSLDTVFPNMSPMP